MPRTKKTVITQQQNNKNPTKSSESHKETPKFLPSKNESTLAGVKSKIGKPLKTMDSEKSKRKHKKDYSSFSIYIYKVLKQVHPHLNMSKIALDQINQFIVILGKEISKNAFELTTRNKKETVSSREIQNTIRMMLPNELGKHAASEGTKAITKFNASVTEVNPRERQVSTKKLNSKKRESLYKIKRERKEIRAGLIFPVGRCKHLIKSVGPKRISIGASIYLAAVLEYLTAEILELSGNASRDNKKVTINSRHIFLVISTDKELLYLVDSLHIEFSGVGVVPRIHVLLIPSHDNPKKKSKKNITVGGSGGPHKPHRFRPGTVALREIRRYQKTTFLLMRKLPFERNFRNCAREFKEDIRFNSGVIEAIQSFVETRLVELLGHSVIYAIDSKRTGLQPKDLLRAKERINIKLLKNDTHKLKEPLSKPGLKRLARRGGVKRIGGLVYEELNNLCAVMINSIANILMAETEHRRMKTVSMDILRASLKQLGYNFIVSDPK